MGGSPILLLVWWTMSDALRCGTEFYFLSSLQDQGVWRLSCTYLPALNWCSIRSRCLAVTSYSTHSVRVKFFLMERKAISVTDLSSTHAPQNKRTMYMVIALTSPWLNLMPSKLLATLTYPNYSYVLLHTLTTPTYSYIPLLLHYSPYFPLLPKLHLVWGWVMVASQSFVLYDGLWWCS